MLLLLAATTTHCVSYRKYEDSKAQADRYKAQTKLQADSLSRLSRDQSLLVTNRSTLEERNRLLSEELTSIKAQYAQLERANTDLLMRYDRVLAQNQAELNASSSELTQLRSRLNQRELDLGKKEAELNTLSNELSTRETELNRRISGLESDLSSTREKVAMSENELTKASSEINQLRSALAAKDAKINALRNRVRAALTGFSASDLSVEERGGRVYVSMSQNLLFSSGSSTLNSGGTGALRQVADVLKSTEGVAVTVEGHTDTDGSPAMNWDLSTARATTVAKQLISNGVAPGQITAAGRGQYAPVASNASADSKARNRRTEIILTPELGELYKLVVGG